MNSYTHQHLLNLGKLTSEDLSLINKRRRVHNRLGFAYQLVFVRLHNYFPPQTPSLEIDNDILAFVGVQLNIDTTIIESYTQRQPTLSEHQELIRTYLNLQSYEAADLSSVQQFIYEEACRLEQTNLLLTKSKQFLRTCHILQPADYTLRRLIVTQRQSARDHIFKQIAQGLSAACRTRLDELLETNGQTFTPFHTLKQAPRQASPKALLRLSENLETIQNTGVLTVDLSWLNNNYQRSLTQYARRCSTGRVSQLTENHRYAILVCFLHQTYQDMVDYIIDTHDKLLTGVYKRAQTDVDEQTKKQRKQMRASLKVLQTLGTIILDEAVDDQELRHTFFDQIAKEILTEHLTTIDDWLNGKYSHVFRLVMERFTYLRQFAPTLLEALTFLSADNETSALLQGIQLLQDLNKESKRKLPVDVPLDFVPKSLRSLVENEDGSISKNGWECALLTAIRDDIRAGNLVVGQSKRFGRFDNFFISDSTTTRL